MALKGHLISGGLVGPLAGIETGSANTLGVFDGSGSAAATTLSDYLDTVIGNDQGTVLYRNATEWTGLAPGTSGQFLKTQGASANPVWGDAVGVTAGTPLVLNPITTSTSTTQAHGLSAAPTQFDPAMECLTAELGYSVGDVVRGTFSFSIQADATNVILNTASAIALLSKTSHSSTVITPANWKITVTPYKLT